MGREPLRGFETLLELGTVRRPVPYLKIEVVLTFPGRLKNTETQQIRFCGHSQIIRRCLVQVTRPSLSTKRMHDGTETSSESRFLRCHDTISKRGPAPWQVRRSTSQGKQGTVLVPVSLIGAMLSRVPLVHAAQATER
jgi:hypothetical protein